MVHSNRINAEGSSARHHLSLAVYRTISRPTNLRTNKALNHNAIMLLYCPATRRVYLNLDYVRSRNWPKSVSECEWVRECASVCCRLERKEPWRWIDYGSTWLMRARKKHVRALIRDDYEVPGRRKSSCRECILDTARVSESVCVRLSFNLAPLIGRVPLRWHYGASIMPRNCWSWKRLEQVSWFDL